MRRAENTDVKLIFSHFLCKEHTIKDGQLGELVVAATALRGLMSFGALRQMNKSLKGRNKRWKRTLSDRSFLEAAVLRGQVSGSNEDLKKQPFTNFLDRARLMNLEAQIVICRGNNS